MVKEGNNPANCSQLQLFGTRRDIRDDLRMLRDAIYSLAEIKEACSALIVLVAQMEKDIREDFALNSEFPNSNAGPNESGF